MKTIIEEPSSTGNLNKQSSYSFSVHMLFLNTPNMLTGGFMELIFCRKTVFCEWITSSYTHDSNYSRKIGCFKLTIA